MLISSYRKRSIADQSGVVDFRFSMSFDNTTGECSVGLSGSRDFHFTFKSGKIYDNGGNFVQSYVRDVPVSLSGQVGRHSYDYAINDELIALGNTLPTGKFSWLYVNPTRTTVDFEGAIRGTVPNYYADTEGKYSYQNQIVSGRLINLNPSCRFKVFDVEVLQPSSPYSVESFTTGDITGTGYINLSSDQVGLSDYVVPLLLRTNFGDVAYNFTVSGDYSLVPDVYLNVSPDTNNVINGVAKDFLAQFSYFPTGAYLGMSLEHVAGTTGNIYFFKDQVSDLQYRLLSGVVEGCARLEAFHTGLVSGQDPETLINEIGTGTGLFTSNTVCATGEVEEDYVLKVFGLGQGFFKLDYTASGFHSGLYSGAIPISGGYLTIVGENFLGTGDSPGVAVGFVPTGTGRFFARPTGCLTISQSLTYNDNYYSGTLSLDKSFSGPLSIPYSVNSVGWATGNFVAGYVDSVYVLNFEQGLYTYNKSYSGLIYGKMTTTGNFEPTGCLAEELDASGIIVGNFSVTRLLDCSATKNLPMIPISGYPAQVYDSKKRLVAANRVIMVQPSGGFGTSETSYNAIRGAYTRTKTSRMGTTSSGEGHFANPVGACLDTQTIKDRVWKETMPYTTSTSTFDAQGNSIGFVSSRMYLTGSGDLESGRAQAQDSGAIHFYISGSGKKAVALRGLNFSQPDRILRMVLMRNSVYYDAWENFSIQPGLNKYRNEVINGTNDYDTIGLTELESGFYSLYISAREADAPTISFSEAEFSGCESARNLMITVKAEGVFREDACVNMVTYEEDTAHSGVNYDPIYLRYDNTGLIYNGCRSLGGKALECPGICFPASNLDDAGMWISETRYYSFTVPIYDNAGFGSDHRWNVSLSNPSGCQLGYPSETTLRIVENDNPVFLVRTGEFMDETGILSGLPYDCVPVPPKPPEPPDPCIFGRELCDNCLANPSDCDNTDDCSGIIPCCSCAGGMVTIAGTCPGYGSHIFSGSIPTPGSICGRVSANGCGPTNGYVYVGDMCCSGSSMHSVFAVTGKCLTTTVRAHPAGCGCDSEDVSEFTDCPDYGGKKRRKRRPTGPGCEPLKVFLSVSEIFGCGSSSSSCSNWQWTGTCYAPRGAGMGSICPPAP